MADTTDDMGGYGVVASHLRAWTKLFFEALRNLVVIAAIGPAFTLGEPLT